MKARERRGFRPDAILCDRRRGSWILVVPARTFIDDDLPMPVPVRPRRTTICRSPDREPLEDRLLTAVLVMWACGLIGGMCYLACVL